MESLYCLFFSVELLICGFIASCSAAVTKASSKLPDRYPRECESNPTGTQSAKRRAGGVGYNRWQLLPIATTGRTADAKYNPRAHKESAMRYDIHMGTGETAPIVYLIDSPDGASLPEARRASTVVRIFDADWDDDLTPWPAKKVFKRSQGDFGGKADGFLERLVEKAIPAIEQEHGLEPSFRALAGYSLAGLFALYALTKTDAFAAIASVSGSLWYDDLVPYLKQSTLPGKSPYAYLSLGDRERLTKNKRMQVVQDRTDAAADFLRAKGAAVDFEQTAGTHFQNVPDKLRRALDAVERNLLARTRQSIE